MSGFFLLKVPEKISVPGGEILENNFFLNLELSCVIIII